MASTAKVEIGFIGGGNMAEALIRGLCGAGREPSAMLVAEPEAKRRTLLARRYRVGTTADNLEVVHRCRTVLLAVKPQIMDEVLAGIAPAAGGRQLLISIAAGVKIARIEKALGGGVKVVRVMPNTPCLVGRGASVLCGGRGAGAADMRRAKAIFSTVGQAWISDSEAQLDPVTGLSGSGPAYVYLFAEALIRGGKGAGLDEEMATRLAYQTIAGAAEMLATTGRSPADLRRAVSSPGGTTVAGLARLAEGGFVETVAAAVKTATRRSRELGRKK